MREFAGRVAAGIRRQFEAFWNYMGSLAAVCLLTAVLGLGIYHAVVRDLPLRCQCYAGVYNPAGAESPGGILPMGRGEVSGVAHVRLELDGQGKVQRMRHVDAEGRLSPLPGSAVAEQRLLYDEHGRLWRKENHAASGALVEDAQGVAVREFTYDPAGRLVRTCFLNAGRKPVSPRFPGYAECKIVYDAQGRPLRVQHLGADGKPVVNAQGEGCVVYEYDDAGSCVRSNFVEGKLTDNSAGVAQEHMEPYEKGSRRCWFNAKGEAVEHADWDAAAVEHDAQLAHGIERRRFYDANGRLRSGGRACAEHLQRCNADGRLVWECYGGADGLPVEHPSLGYAERVCEYAPDGALAREYFWDAQGNPAAISENRHAATPDGEFKVSLHRDGATSVQPL